MKSQKKTDRYASMYVTSVEGCVSLGGEWTTTPEMERGRVGGLHQQTPVPPSPPSSLLIYYNRYEPDQGTDWLHLHTTVTVQHGTLLSPGGGN